MANDLKKWAAGLRRSDELDARMDFGSSKGVSKPTKAKPIDTGEYDKPITPAPKRAPAAKLSSADEASAKAKASGTAKDHMTAYFAHAAEIAKAYGAGDLKNLKAHMDAATSHMAAADKAIAAGRGSKGDKWDRAAATEREGALSDFSGMKKGDGGGGDQPRDDHGRFAGK